MAQQLRVDIVKEVEAAQAALKPALTKLKKILTLNPAKTPAGSLVDLLYTIRETSKQISSIGGGLQDQLSVAQKQIEEHFIESLKVGESSGVQGMEARVQVTEALVPVVQDWDKFYAHIKKRGEFELLNRAVNREAVRERWEEKKQVPGVTAFHAKKVSCTKLSGRKK